MTFTTNTDNIYQIKFHFKKDKFVVNVENIIAYDTETTNGVLLPDNTAITFDHDKYNHDPEFKSLIDNNPKVSCVYMWQCGIESDQGPIIFYGRTMTEYLDFMIKLTKEIRRQYYYGYHAINREQETEESLTTKQYFHIQPYIHNFAFDFQVLRNIFDDQFGKHHGIHANTFARSERRPMKANATLNKVHIEYRDSYVLTQKSLAKWGKDSNLPVQKIKVDEEFYLKSRNPNTPLTTEEIEYGCTDVVTMIYGIQQYRDKYKTLSNIPLTQTGEIRRTCIKEVAIKNPDWALQCYQITQKYTYEFFKKLCHLFQGGWTHANAYHTHKLLHNLKCFDFASSYPAVMTTRTFPVGEFQDVDPDQFEDFAKFDPNNTPYHWFIEVEFTDVQTKLQNTYWSTSKTLETPQDCIPDNGRIFSCSILKTTMTDLDFDTFKQCYSYKSMKVISLYVAEADYLPKELIELILTYYAYKTSLKDVEGAESKYTEAKQFVNSIYGCAVTKIVTDIIDYSLSGWKKTPCDYSVFNDTIEHMKAERTFLSYQIGIWVTAHARHNLFDFIIKFDPRIAYCDTDSIKGMFTDEDLKFIEDYNKHIEELENKVADHYHLDPNLYCPKTPTGKQKRLGIMAREEDCIEFVTLGAKRYADSIINSKGEEEIQTTIAGLPKKAGPLKIKKVSDMLKSNLVWSTEESLKQTSYYNDNQPTIQWTDYLGNTYISDEKYGCCLLPTTFDLSMSKQYSDFLDFIETEDPNYLNDTPIDLR